MNKSQKPSREKVVPIQERDLAFAKGADEASSGGAYTLKQHVDNPGQTPMKDGS
ncbi:MAG TPA: hypothetical protein VGG03_16060 [Thermoanaerobaculia bacterium]|jgi:hypothetical protein